VSTSEENELIEKQSTIASEFNALQKVRPMRFEPWSDTILIPNEYRPKSQNIFQCINHHWVAKLVFHSLSAMSYLVYHTDEVSVSEPQSFANRVPKFLTWLQTHDIDNNNKHSIIKDFEAYRVNDCNVSPQGSYSREIIKFIKCSLAFEKFSSLLLHDERKMLNILVDTKLAPKGEMKQFTLTDWFSSHSWLRTEDGIGNELFNHLASPKILMRSFSTTIATVLVEIQRQKLLLIEFFQASSIEANMLSIEDRWDTKRSYYPQVHAHIANLLIQHATKDVMDALKTLLHDFSYPLSRNHVLTSLETRTKVSPYTHGKTNFVTTESSSDIFNIEIIIKLCNFGKAKDPCAVVPTTEAEKWLFTWLMGWQMVQTNDIPKLTLSNFSFLKKNNGRISHIDFLYYKTRASIEHTPPLIETRSIEGTAILNYLSDKTSGLLKKYNNIELVSKTKHADFPITEGSKLGKLFKLICSDLFYPKVENSLKLYDASPVFLKAIKAFQEEGEPWYDYKLSRGQYIQKYEKTIPALIYTSTHIKNSRVHAKSDKFSPSQLINYNSHTSEVERKHYLSEQNEVWLNSCGRITRAVMQDLITNVLRPSTQEEFNSEFLVTNQCIATRSNDTLARLKLISGKENGWIADDMGFIKTKPFDEDFPSTIYVLDSPETVMTYMHYQSQVRKKYRVLIRAAPEFLLFTVCPTSEWIEVLFDQTKFSKTSIEKGKELYQQYGSELPPLFEAQIRG